jgi:hypothetical protein
MHMADGRRLRVPHPEFRAYSPSGRTILVTHRDDTFSIVDLLPVTELKVANGRRPNPSNGSN